MKEKDLLERLETAVADRTLLASKEVLTSEEAARYCGFSRGYLYKLTMERKIPHYKPTGKMCYFNRKDLEAWLQRNRMGTDEELEAEAQRRCKGKGGAR